MKTTYRNILIFLAIILLIAGAWFFQNIVAYILISGVLSIIGRPLVDLFCKIHIKKWHFPRSLGALMTLLLIWGVIVLFFIIFVPLVTKQINYFSSIDSEKIVQLIDAPISKAEQLLKSFNPKITEELYLKENFV